MGAKNLTGTWRSVRIKGVSYNVAADGSPNAIPSKWSKESIPTSGTPMIKMIRRAEDVESVDLAVNADEVLVLKGVAEELDAVTLSYTTAAGDSYDASGHVHLDARDYTDGKLPVKLLPQTDWQLTVGA